MPQIIKVKLLDDVLQVDQTNGDNAIDYPANLDLQLKLDNATLPGATFLPMGAAGGFIWISTPPDGVFGEPRRIGNDRIVQLKVTHGGPDSAGCWIYMIRVLFRGYIYWTTVSRTECSQNAGGGTMYAMVSNNPIIINR